MNAGERTPGSYHSPLREAQAQATRARILDATGRLIERGTELTYAGIAELAGVQERTVYRHFPTKDELHAAFWQRTNEALQPLADGVRDRASLLGLVKRSFAEFDAREQLIRAMLHSEVGRSIRRQASAERRRRFEYVIAAELPQLNAAARRRAAAVAQVLSSATTWEHLRDYWEMDGAEASACAALAIEALLEGLRAAPARPDTPSSRGRKRTKRATRARKGSK